MSNPQKAFSFRGGGFAPAPTWPGALPLDPAGGSAPTTRYTLMLCTRHSQGTSNFFIQVYAYGFKHWICTIGLCLMSNCWADSARFTVFTYLLMVGRGNDVTHWSLAPLFQQNFPRYWYILVTSYIVYHWSDVNFLLHICVRIFAQIVWYQVPY